MKDSSANKSRLDSFEPGEEKLAILIKEAGSSARLKKKKAMEEHFRKIRMTIMERHPFPSA
jgi:hypothetical protein